MNTERIQSVEPAVGEVICTNKNIYTRYTASNWSKLYGQSWEPYYMCEDIENLYQEWLRSGRG
jgi:hypothetical protein